MKKYNILGDLLIDFRRHRGMSQLDFAALLDVDVRTVIRWEKNESLIKVEKEKELIEYLGIPHQVIRNLNTDKPISVYFDFERWAYSLSFLSSMVRSSQEFKYNSVFDTERIHTISNDKDFEFITYIQKNQKNCNPLREEVLRQAAKILPELNLVLLGNSGFHSGHTSILPLKYDSYLKIRDRIKQENELNVNDLNWNFDDTTPVFYYYSLYTNSLDNTYYLMNRILSYFKKRKFKDYKLAGISYRKNKVERLQEMGLQIIWEQPMDEENNRVAIFVEGNLDEFLFA